MWLQKLTAEREILTRTQITARYEQHPSEFQQHMEDEITTKCVHVAQKQWRDINF